MAETTHFSTWLIRNSILSDQYRTFSACSFFRCFHTRAHVHTLFTPLAIFIFSDSYFKPSLHTGKIKHHNFNLLPKLMDKDAYINLGTHSYLRHRSVWIFKAMLLNCLKEEGDICSFPRSPWAHHVLTSPVLLLSVPWCTNECLLTCRNRKLLLSPTDLAQLLAGVWRSGQCLFQMGRAVLGDTFPTTVLDLVQPFPLWQLTNQSPLAFQQNFNFTTTFISTFLSTSKDKSLCLKSPKFHSASLALFGPSKTD